MDKQTTNQVRQILMNELGLTRESVRDEVNKIVEDAVEKSVQRWENEGIIERAVQSEVSRRIASWHGDRNALRRLVTDVAIDAVKLQLDGCLQVSLTPPAE